MNYLQLCQMAARETGAFQGTQPTSVANQTGKLARVVQHVADAWRKLQVDKPDWRFSRLEMPWTGTVTSKTVANTQRYAAASFGITSWSGWMHDTRDADGNIIRRYFAYEESVGVADTQDIQEISWEEFRRKYIRGSQTADRPVEWAESPSGEFCLGPVPDDVYVIGGEYVRGAQTLAENADEPFMPARFHDIIAWDAVVLYGEYDEIPQDRLNAARSQSLRWRNDLERDQLPPPSIEVPPIA